MLKASATCKLSPIQCPPVYRHPRISLTIASDKNSLRIFKPNYPMNATPSSSNFCGNKSVPLSVIIKSDTAPCYFVCTSCTNISLEFSLTVGQGLCETCSGRKLPVATLVWIGMSVGFPGTNADFSNPCSHSKWTLYCDRGGGAIDLKGGGRYPRRARSVTGYIARILVEQLRIQLIVLLFDRLVHSRN
jgi:hypothetical protein